MLGLLDILFALIFNMMMIPFTILFMTLSPHCGELPEWMFCM